MAITVNGKKKIDYGNPQTTVTKSNNYESEVARILNNSGVSTAGLNLRNTSPAQKTSVTAADTYFNSANLNNPNPGTYAVGADGNAPRGLGVGDTVSTAGGNYEITNALAPGANYNANTGYWSRRTTDNYGVPLETGGNYNFEQRPQGYTKPAYTSQWQQDINNAVAQLLGYDFDTYKQGSEYAGLERDYTRLGQRAMDDTLGKIAARTGGMASSYAGTVGQQAYNDYMSQLEAAARQAYQQERSNQQNDINLLMALEDQDYGKYRDLLSQYNTDRGFDYNLFSDDYDRRHEQARERIADERYDTEYADQRADVQYDRDMAAAQTMAAAGDFSGLAKQWNLDPASTEALVKQWAKEQGISDMQAAMEIADWYAQYGDYSRFMAMGGNASYPLAQQRAAMLGTFGQVPEYWSWSGPNEGNLPEGIATMDGVPASVGGLSDAIGAQVLASESGALGGASGGGSGESSSGGRRSSGGSRRSSGGTSRSSSYNGAENVEAVPLPEAAPTDSGEWSPKQTVKNILNGTSSTSTSLSRQGIAVRDLVSKELQNAGADRAGTLLAALIQQYRLPQAEANLIKSQIGLY